MAAVTDDHGTWDDPSSYYESDNYRNRPDGFRIWFFRQMIGGINHQCAANPRHLTLLAFGAQALCREFFFLTAS
ncbi:MAG: hypothetical protein ACX93P_08340 [Roseovarius sp.]